MLDKKKVMRLLMGCNKLLSGAKVNSGSFAEHGGVIGNAGLGDLI